MDCLKNWVEENRNALSDTEWFGGEKISVEDFVVEYLIPTIESNVQYDFGVDMDASEIVG